MLVVLEVPCAMRLQSWVAGSVALPRYKSARAFGCPWVWGVWGITSDVSMTTSCESLPGLAPRQLLKQAAPRQSKSLSRGTCCVPCVLSMVRGCYVWRNTLLRSTISLSSWRCWHFTVHGFLVDFGHSSRGYQDRANFGAHGRRREVVFNITART